MVEQLQEITRDTKVELTPKWAEELFGHNWHNRNLRQDKVLRIAEAIDRGEWEYNGDPIRMGNVGGRLVVIDGQHRLAACILAGIPVETDIMWNCPLTMQDNIDNGTKRRLSDQLELRGEHSVQVLAATLVWYHKWTNGRITSGTSHRHAPTNPQAFALLDANPNIRESIRWGGKAGKMVPQSIGAMLHYAFAQVSREDADEFIRLVQTGDGQGIGDPPYALRKRCEKARSDAQTTRTTHYAAWTIKAWNNWIQGLEMKQVKYLPGGKNPEKFPHIVGWRYDGDVPVEATGL